MELNHVSLLIFSVLVNEYFYSVKSKENDAYL